MTLLEVIVAMIIVGLVMLGLTGIFLSGKKYLQHARARMAGGQFGRIFLNPLQGEVRQDTWNTWGATCPTSGTCNDLAIPSGASVTRYCDNDATHTQQSKCPTATNRTIQGIRYDAKYEIATIASTDVRRVKATLTWTEPTP